jgi:hypothetical protein
MEFIFIGVSVYYLGRGIHNNLKSRHFTRQIHALDQAKNFDLEYLPSVTALPQGKPICLRGVLTMQRPQKSIIDPGLELSLNSFGVYIEPSEEVLETEGVNRVAYFPIADLPADSFYLKNEKNELLLLNFTKDSTILLHNASLVFPNPEDPNLSRYRPKLAVWDRIFPETLFAGKEGEIFETGVTNGETYNFIGTVEKYRGSVANPMHAQLMMTTSMVTGEMRENLMRHLDNKIMLASKRFKSSQLVSFSLGCMAVAWKKHIRPVLEEASLRK